MSRPTPAQRVAAACQLWGDHEVIRRCIAVLALPPNEVQTGDGAELAVVLGDLAGADWLAAGKGPEGHRYWARVWAARALRYVWDDSATHSVIEALRDDHWRVREMASNVVRDREIAEAADSLVDALTDGHPRVRAAAVRALGDVGEGEHGESIRSLEDDPEPSVRSAAELALQTLSTRLDRPM